jgi:hypothetical protein
MIKIERGAPPAALEAARKQAEQWLREYRQISSRADERMRDKKIKEFFEKLPLDTAHYAPPEAKMQLYIEHYGKCAYCETRIVHSQYGDVEHFRPKLGVEVVNKEGSIERATAGYYWLAFQWQNLLLSCGSCNQEYKKNSFGMLPDAEVSDAEESYPGHGPLEIPHSRPAEFASPENPDLVERAVLIDPSRENPREMIFFHPGTAIAEPRIVEGTDPELGAGRGGKTVNDLGLNREPLVEMRRQRLMHLHSLFLCALNSIDTLKVVLSLGDRYSREWPIATRWRELQEFILNGAQSCDRSEPELEGCGLALVLLGWSVHPGAEYSAMAADAICEWSKAELPRPRNFHGYAALQGPKDMTLPVGGTINLKMQLPMSYLETIGIQTRDYSAVIKRYCDKRGMRDTAQQDRERLYPQMNELINRYTANWNALQAFGKMQLEQQVFTLVKDHLEDYLEQFQNDIDGLDFADDGEPTGPSEAAQLETLQTVQQQIRRVHEDISKSRSMGETVSKLDNFRALLFNEIPGFYNSQSGKIAPQQSSHWIQRHKDFLEHLHAITVNENLEKHWKEFLIDTIEDEYLEILNDLMALLLEFHRAGTYSDTVRTREVALKKALNSAIAAISDFLNGKRPTPLPGDAPERIQPMKARAKK